MSKQSFSLVAPSAPKSTPALTPDQLAAVAHRGSPLVINGGPGTGKTTVLVEAALARIAEGQNPDSILLLTFGRERASGTDESERLIPPKKLNMEGALEFCREDECVEVTPAVVRIRKVVLDQSERARTASRQKKANLNA